MSQALTVELSDEVYTALSQKAAAVGLTAAEYFSLVCEREHGAPPDQPVTVEAPPNDRTSDRTAKAPLVPGNCPG
jgi:hypothetical protein